VDAESEHFVVAFQNGTIDGEEEEEGTAAAEWHTIHPF
jgi:hypothetical protein